MSVLPYKLKDQPCKALSVLKSYCCSNSAQHLIQKRFLRDDKCLVDFRLDALGQRTLENKTVKKSKEIDKFK